GAAAHPRRLREPALDRRGAVRPGRHAPRHPQGKDLGTGEADARWPPRRRRRFHETAFRTGGTPVNEENVLLFDPESRGGMARRGAPDKSGPPATEWVVLRCPTCGSDLRVEASWTEGHA